MPSLLNSEETTSRLIAQWGYPEYGARKLALMLSQLQPPLAAHVARWWETGEPVELQVEGCTLETLKRDHGMNDIAGILTLDWLLRDPATALAQLARGHDHVQ